AHADDRKCPGPAQDGPGTKRSYARKAVGKLRDTRSMLTTSPWRQTNAGSTMACGHRVPGHHRLVQWVVAVLALSLPVVFTPKAMPPSSAPLDAPQLDKSASPQPGSRRKKMGDDRGLDSDTWSHSHHAGSKGATASSPSGYNSEHIKTFW